MQEPSDPSPQAKPAKPRAISAREARLKAALKANMGRRKAQAKARSAQADAPRGDEIDDSDDNNKNE